jgi:hypothetical protein
MASRSGTVEVVLEVGAKRVFASAVDWPGWSRSARGEEAALDALVAYADRYAPVAAAAGLRLPVGQSFTVIERVRGNATTDFGAPGALTGPDFRPVAASDANRLVALVGAAWEVLDTVAAGAPAELRKGPRGGGRDRDKMLAHVASAEAAYARRIGLRLHEPAPGDAKAVRDNRAAILEVLGRASDGERLVEPKGWPARYAAQRIAWHALDHAWEIEDRSGPL